MSLKLFFLRGEIRYTPGERREEREREIQPCGKGREIWVQARPINISGTSRYIPYGKSERVRDMQDIWWAERPNHMVGGKAQSCCRWKAPIIWRVGKAQSDQWGKQRPSPGGQRPSSARAPTRTSRRASIGQGDLPHTRDTTSTLRMQGNHKEQHGSHSLNRWKERFALWHRHAGMLTGSEPYKLRGILSKGLRALMTRFGPSPERGPGTQPTK